MENGMYSYITLRENLETKENQNQQPEEENINIAEEEVGNSHGIIV